MNITELAADYERDGYVSGVPILTQEEVTYHRAALEKAEHELNASLHYKFKVHTILTSPYELATRPEVLDLVEAMIGPDILLYNVTYIIKEPHSTSYVSWHQDLTYWGLSHSDQVSMWLALSDANEMSGGMRMIPGSHKLGQINHETGSDSNNVLLQSQTVQNVDESQAVLCALKPGEASFHHGWTLHASMPNKSDDRRIGLNVQFFAAHLRQTKHDLDTAMLVRGKDDYGHFEADIPASTDLDPVAIIRRNELEERYKMIAGQT